HKAERIVPLAYGEDFGDLAPFLRGLISRTQHPLRQTRHGPTERVKQRRMARGKVGTITVADSGLVVIKSILLAWGLDQFVDAVGYDVEYVNEPWSTSVLDAVASGHLGMAIFNQERSIEFETSHRSYLRILGVFGYSMGGRNFCILAHREGKWAGVSAEEFLQAPRDARICVGLGTDRFQNLLQAFGRTEPELRRQGVTLINISEPSLDVFLNDRDILLVGGQNTRFEAVISGEYLELVRYESLPNDRREWFRRSAANALVISEDLNAKLLRAGVRDLYPSLKREFFGNWQDPRSFSELLDCVIRDCEFACSHPGDRERIARHILYETYRIGEPIW
ncbi:MAG: hypothetical protein M3256_22570, partial [Actinomycetota bacterium]|nr:hypothetical protein [Actinomycetota bacterium]